LIEHFKLS